MKFDDCGQKADDLVSFISSQKQYWPYVYAYTAMHGVQEYLHTDADSLHSTHNTYMLTLIIHLLATVFVVVTLSCTAVQGLKAILGEAVNRTNT